MRKDFFTPRKLVSTRYYLQAKFRYKSLLYENEFVLDFEESSIGDLRKHLIDYLRVWNVEFISCSDLYVVNSKTSYNITEGFNLTSDIKNLLQKGEE